MKPELSEQPSQFTSNEIQSRAGRLVFDAAFLAAGASGGGYMGYAFGEMAEKYVDWSNSTVTCLVGSALGLGVAIRKIFRSS